jgi:hypothetical protein
MPTLPRKKYFQAASIAANRPMNVRLLAGIVAYPIGASEKAIDRTTVDPCQRTEPRLVISFK